MARFRLIFKTESKHGAMGAAWVEVCPAAGPEGELVLTHDCSPAELEKEIASLKAELDGVLRAAKARSDAYMHAKTAQQNQS